MRKYTTILFDLDGTLLPMDQDLFTKTYFKELAIKLAPLGFDPQALAVNIWAGVAAMVKNDGSVTNEEAFWQAFSHIYGETVRQYIPVFEEFYANEFQKAKKVCGFSPKSKELVEKLKEAGYQVVLATNPIFPAIATQSRIRWAGLEPEDFLWYTTYENSSFSKPNPKYYEEIMGKLGLDPRDCLMVGNDVTEDGAAKALGMDVFFLTDCLINKEEKDISQEPHGSFGELEAFILG
ncbi:MAG: HAD family hydrolase [Ruminiclostridium sp.]|nr:HAD family hydrolase [Ruminiclostridium sp.]